MMTEEQVGIVRTVYNRFIGSEEEIWTDLDNNLELFGFLSDVELIKEAHIKVMEHSNGVFRCSQNHKQEHCMAPYILDAVNAILDLYQDTLHLHVKNRYILEYYICMSELRMIYLDQ